MYMYLHTPVSSITLYMNMQPHYGPGVSSKHYTFNTCLGHLTQSSCSDNMTKAATSSKYFIAARNVFKLYQHKLKCSD